jgi:hypothetical protein
MLFVYELHEAETMSSGFNTDVRVGDRVFHVQTEDRGPNRPVIDTTVYQNGRVVHRRNSNYKHFAESAEFNPEDLRGRVEEQHRCVIEDLRSGAVSGNGSATAVAEAEPPAASPPGIQLQLLNPESWLTAGTVSLSLEILSRGDQRPQSKALVEALIEGSLDETRHRGTTDSQGHVQIRFPMPKLGKGGLALVIQAKAEHGADELRYVMRSNPKPSPQESSS